MILFRQNRKQLYHYIITWTLLFLFARPVTAALHEQLSIDAKAISLSNTVTSSPPGIMSIHYNPAGLSQLKEGKQFVCTFTGMHVEIKGDFQSDPAFKGFLDGVYEDDPLNGASGKTTDFYGRYPFFGEIQLPDGNVVIPASFGFSYKKPDSRWTFANGFYAPYFLGYSHKDKNDPQQYGGKSLYIEHIIYLSPSLSYEFSDFFSAGISIGLGQSYMGSEFSVRSPNNLSKILTDPEATGDILGETIPPPLSDLAPWFGGGLSPYESLGSIKFIAKDNFTPSTNIGILWEPGNHFAFGACYQSEVKAKMRGQYYITYSDAFQNIVNWLGSGDDTAHLAEQLNLPESPLAKEKGNCSMEFIFPARLQIGVTFRPFKTIKIMSDLHWTEGSSNKSFTIHFDRNIQMLQFLNLPGTSNNARELTFTQHMKDTIHFSYGLELLPFSGFSFRCGYEKRVSSMANSYYSLLLPIPDLDIYGAGCGISMKNGIRIDFAGSYMINNRYKVPSNTSKQLNSTDFTDVIYNPYAGLDYEQSTKLYELSVTITMPTQKVSSGIGSISNFIRQLIKKSPVQN